MKKIALLVVVSLVACIAYTQTQKGSFYFGLTGSAANLFESRDNNGTAYKTNTQYDFSIGLNAGYFFKNNFSIGITSNYNSVYKINYLQSSPIIDKEGFWYAPLSATVHARKYFMFTPNFGVYPQINTGAVFGLARRLSYIDETAILTAEGNLQGFTANIGGGMTWFPFKKAKRLNIDVFVNMLGFQSVLTSYKEPSTRENEYDNTFSFFKASVGINYYIFKQQDSK